MAFDGESGRLSPVPFNRISFLYVLIFSQLTCRTGSVLAKVLGIEIAVKLPHILGYKFWDASREFVSVAINPFGWIPL